MKKITDFIIDKRYVILFLFIILSGVSVILSNKVNINYDISEYLPSTSETRIGMDIMEEEFKEIKSSYLNVMFKGLKDSEKDDIFDYLNNIEGAGSVDYDETGNYNKDDYTLFVINVDDLEDSELSSNIYDDIISHFDDYEMYTSGTIAERNEPVLPMWIMVLAVGCALIILTIMCESYVEPVLFLISILMAVLLNKGSNIIFDSVSNITDSISAILQMALSMDYSIMLMDRYRQERETEYDKVKAMKNALYHAFTAISSSSVTTIVGLVSLVFMSFTIGRDLGFVLAKGVLFSLICIFFVLPALILMCDKFIVKTKKKCPNIKLDSVGKVSYRFRKIAIILFIIVLVGSYLLKGNLGILYTESQSDMISEVFAENNQIAIIYDSSDEEVISKYLKELEDNDKIENILGYGNTINEELSYSQLPVKIRDLGSDIDVSEYLIKILYYRYYNQNDNNTMSFNEFTSFISNYVYDNSVFSEKLDKNTKSNIEKLENFTDPLLINKKRTAEEIANILDIDIESVNNLLIYYNSINNNLKISLDDFISFMNKDVLTNDTYVKNIDSNAISSLNLLANFVNKDIISNNMTSVEMANLFGIDEEIMQSLYTYYVSINGIDIKITISEFSNFILNDVLVDSQYSNLFDEETINNIKMLATFSDNSIITKNMSSMELANLFDIDESTIKQILLLKYGAFDNGTSLSIGEFIDNVIYIEANTNYLDNLDISNFSELDQTILSDTTKYTATEMSNILNMDTKQLYQIYSLIDFIQNNTDNWQITPQEFVNLILTNGNNIDETTKSKLQFLSVIMDSSVSNLQYSYEEIAKLVGIDSNILRNIYILYLSKNTTVVLTPQEFVDFVLNHKNDEMLSSNIDVNTINQLVLVQDVMNGALNNKKYDSLELSNLLGIKDDDLKLLYGLYNVEYINTKQTISLNDFVSFLLNYVISNSDYSINFDKEASSKLSTINNIMVDSLNNVEYTKDELFSILSSLSGELDKNAIDLLYMYYGSIYKYNDNWTLTVEKFVNFLNNNILEDSRLNNLIDKDMRKSINDANDMIKEAKELLVGKNYSRVIINTKFELESEETFNFIKDIKSKLEDRGSNVYIIGDSPMAYEMSESFQGELDFITILTMIAIFIVVAITFKSLIIPFILVLLIQCAVYTTMGILSFSGEGVYFIAILIVQSILMGATIDYAILYTSYYIEHRKNMAVKEAIISSYNKSINTILTSASILVIVTYVVGIFSSGITSRICNTLSQGTLCAALLILILLPAMIAACDKIIMKKKI